MSNPENNSPEIRDFSDPTVENEAQVAEALKVLGISGVRVGGRTPAREGGNLTGEVYAVYHGTDEAGNPVEVTIRKSDLK